MRILYLNHNIAGRGTYFRCLHFARQVVRAGHAVDLVTASPAPRLWWFEDQVDGVYVLHTPRIWAPGRHDGGYAPMDILARLLFVLRRYDLIHAFDHRPNVSFPAAFARRIWRTPVVVDWADWWTRGGITTSRRRWGWIDAIEARLEEGQKRRADAVTVTSTALYERALAIGVPRERLVLLPSGADVDSIPVLDRAECRAELGLPTDTPLALLAGYSLWDLDHLLEAVQHAATIVPHMKLMVVGLEKEGGTEQMISARGLEEHVLLVGSVPFVRLPVYLGAADVQVLPLRDTLANRARGPIKLGDYLASGRPVVTQRVGDGATLIEQHGAGVVAECDARSLGEALAGLLRDPERCVQMGANARRFAEQEGSWQQCVQPLLALYHRLERRI